MDNITLDTLSEQAIDWCIRRAMRILEHEQTRLPTTADVADRVGFSQFHFVRPGSVVTGCHW